jgi:succinate dehydrogenase/fumarate reductase flavoprotein subunit
VGAPNPLVRLIARGALVRAGGRGVHFRVDHSAADDAFAGHIVVRGGEHPLLERWS